MFGMGRRKSCEKAIAVGDTRPERDEMVAEVNPTQEAVEVAVPADVDEVDEPVDRMFMAMIAALDMSLAELSRTCDRIEQLVAS